MFKPATSTAQLRFRKPIALAGAALLGLSLLLTAAPALGAANHGGGNNSGTVKVHDATSGAETNGNDNEPHVCSFWLEFDFADTDETGTWFVVSWAPTGDGSTVASGTYDTTGDGSDQSSLIVLPAGHYRAEWAATGESTTNKKTFWVDAGCDETQPPADENVPPSDDPAPPADEPPADENVPPSDDPAPPADEPPADENVPPSDDPAPATDEAPADENVPPSDDPAPATDEAPADEEVLAGESDAEDPAPPSDETVVEDPAPQSDEAQTPASDEESAPDLGAQAEDPGSTDEGTPPDQGQLGGNENTDGPPMADTSVATLPVQSGLMATVGLLLLILVHGITRRERYAERD